jgi:hypothetical protein
LALAPAVTGTLGVDSAGERQQFVAMRKTTTRLTAAVARAVTDAPCTLRALAEAAAVPPSTLSRIVTGERAVTVAVALAVADALDRMSTRAAQLARGIRQAHTPRRTV